MTDTPPVKCDRTYVSTANPKIVQAERTDNGVTVTFESGQSAFYSADLLWKILLRAYDISSLDVDDVKSLNEAVQVTMRHPP